MKKIHKEQKKNNKNKALNANSIDTNDHSMSAVTYNESSENNKVTASSNGYTKATAVSSMKYTSKKTFDNKDNDNNNSDNNITLNTSINTPKKSFFGSKSNNQAKIPIVYPNNKV